MKKNKGSTMVEVLAGFVILMILMASAIGIIKLSANMVFNTKDIENEQLAFEQHIYSNNSDGKLEVTEMTDDLSLVETDYQGTPMGNGIEVPLEGAVVKRYDDPVTGLSAYNIIFKNRNED